MALIYMGRSEAEWLQLFTAVKAEELAATNGDRFISVSTGGKSYQRRVRSMDEILATYGQCLTALQNLNPTAYGTNTQTVNVTFGGYQAK